MNRAEFRKIRKALGLTQAKLATELAIDPRSVRRYEADPRFMSARKIPGPVAEMMKLFRDSAIEPGEPD